MFKYFFWTLLIVACGYALLKGRRDERIVAAACLAASVATKFVISPVAIRYSGIEIGVVAIDMAMLAVFVTIALHSQRFWPLWIAGLQLTTSMAHLLKAIEWDLLPRAYAAAAVFWSYPMLFILALATWRSRTRYAETFESPA